MVDRLAVATFGADKSSLRLGSGRLEIDGRTLVSCAGGPTKIEVAHISISKLDIHKGDVFADIGCGTGLMSILASQWAGKIYAIDDRDEAIEAVKKNLAEFHVPAEIIKGEASQVLRQLPMIDCAFVGGTRNIEHTLEALAETLDGRAVINVVRLETAARTVSKLRELNMLKEVVHVQLLKGYELAGELVFKPINPVYVVVADTRLRGR